MTPETTNALATFGVAVIFALVFYGQSWWQWPKPGQPGSHRFVSFSAGVAVAYVFIHLLPELASVSEEFVEISEGRELPYPQLRIYAAALVSFVLFYGLSRMISWSRLTAGEADRESALEGIHYHLLAGSYALYVLVVSYLMAHEMEAGGGRLALYALAMGMHFLGLAYGLRRDNPSLYDSWGRHMLGGAAIVGWVVAVLLPVSEEVAYTMLGFVAGAVMLNTATSELPGHRDGRFFAFLLGSVVYTVVLLLIAH